MSLRGCVGRYTSEDGRHCQNWPDDQLAVIDLLNSVAADDGGAGGTLDGNINGRLVAGISSDALYHAIARFEDRHFPGQCSGFITPDGPLLRRLEALSAPNTDDSTPTTFADTGPRLSQSPGTLADGPSPAGVIAKRSLSV